MLAPSFSNPAHCKHLSLYSFVAIIEIVFEKLNFNQPMAILTTEILIELILSSTTRLRNII